MFLPLTITSLGDAARADWVIAGAASKAMARATVVMRVFIVPILETDDSNGKGNRERNSGHE
jgi:hypothetical protein